MNKTTQPIKDKRRIEEILTYLRGKSSRNYMIAKIQLNTARRISDIIGLKVSDFYSENGKLKESLTIKEKKTGKEAKIALNNSLCTAIANYMDEEGLQFNDYLFQSRKGRNKPVSLTQVHRIFQDVAQALHLEDFGTHSLRKSWGYRCYQETRNIGLIMSVLNHGSERETLRYIGITQKDIDKSYLNINF